MLQLEVLWRLQSIDREINMLKNDRRIKELQKRLVNIREQYVSVKEAFDRNIEYKKQVGEDIAKLNGELKIMENRLSQDSRELYRDGQNLKTIDNLQKEMETCKGRIGEAEDRLLKAMERDEKLDDDIRQNEKTMAALKDDFNRLKETYDQESRIDRDRLEKLNRQRADILNEIDSSMLSQYDSIAGKKINPVSRVIDGTCQECGVRLNTILYETVKRKNAICLCEHCGRILYID